jgi:hypothetical protein
MVMPQIPGTDTGGRQGCRRRNPGQADSSQVTRGEKMSAVWVRSSLSFPNGNCVEVASLPGGEIGVRNSRDPGGPVLKFSQEEWDAFLGRARLGEFGRFGGTVSRPGT